MAVFSLCGLFAENKGRGRKSCNLKDTEESLKYLLDDGENVT